ncbi:MAG: hypothetical protein R3310_16345, partial [Candidatus Competibacteraceae bacterium]|nr:hypothetical protein [Candidatus Competibacteraceae bacterium]
MSYILDALQKAERERALGRVPDLATTQLPTTVRRHPWPWLLGAALALANLMVVGVVLWPTEPSGLKTASTPIQAADSSGTPTFPESKAAEPKPAEPKPAEPKPAEPVVQGESPRALPETPAPLLTVPWETDPLSRMATLPAPLVTREPSPEPAPRPAAPVETLSRLPADFRNQLPRLRIDALAFYDKEPRRSFTLINLSRYQQGDRLDEGPVLE